MCIEKPMLACSVSDLEKYISTHGTVAATDKIDGIRALMRNGCLVSRTLKPIPNSYIRQELQKVLPEGADGELVVGLDFQESTSTIMSRDGIPSGVSFMWFDYIHGAQCGYLERVNKIQEYINNNKDKIDSCPISIIALVPTNINSMEEFTIFESKILSSGGEGVILRTINGPYKFGRCTEREGYMVKVKKFSDSEARIIGFVEKMHNNNEATIDNLGRTKRTKCKENLVPSGTLGAIQVEDIYSGVRFEIGVFKGLTKDMLQNIWNNQSSYMGKIVNYTYQSVGVKNLPRIPSFRGFRSEDDL